MNTSLATCFAAMLLAAAPAYSQDSASGSGPVLHTPRDVSGAVRACWRVPDPIRKFERAEATVRFSLRVDGSLIGERRVSFVHVPADAALRGILARSVIEAVEACSPLNISPGLGRAVAGRVFAVRFIYRGPQGRGV